MKTIPAIEDAMAEIHTQYLSHHEVLEEYKRLLSIMGNVDGNEVVTLVILAMANTNQIPSITKR